jgi:hypothetical protein
MTKAKPGNDPLSKVDPILKAKSGISLLQALDERTPSQPDASLERLTPPNVHCDDLGSGSDTLGNDDGDVHVDDHLIHIIDSVETEYESRCSASEALRIKQANEAEESMLMLLEVSTNDIPDTDHVDEGVSSSIFNQTSTASADEKQFSKSIDISVTDPNKAKPIQASPYKKMMFWMAAMMFWMAAHGDRVEDIYTQTNLTAMLKEAEGSSDDGAICFSGRNIFGHSNNDGICFSGRNTFGHSEDDGIYFSGRNIFGHSDDDGSSFSSRSFSGHSDDDGTSFSSRNIFGHSDDDGTSFSSRNLFGHSDDDGTSTSSKKKIRL